MTSIVKAVKWLWLFLLLTVSACCFHLRGAFELPDTLSSVYISAPATTVLVEDLKTILETNKSVVVTDATAATSTIKIEKEQNSQRVLSVDGSGRAREYELNYSVTFSVSAMTATDQSKNIINSKKLDLVRDYVYDSSAVLGKSREKNILIRDMQRDASRLIMLQIQAAYRKSSAYKPAR